MSAGTEFKREGGLWFLLIVLVDSTSTTVNDD